MSEEEPKKTNWPLIIFVDVIAGIAIAIAIAYF